MKKFSLQNLNLLPLAKEETKVTCEVIKYIDLHFYFEIQSDFRYAKLKHLRCLKFSHYYFFGVDFSVPFSVKDRKRFFKVLKLLS